MQTQQTRDEKTVAIATALGIFVTVLAVASALLWGLTAAFDLSEHSTSPLFGLVVGASAVAPVVYLVRSGRR